VYSTHGHLQVIRECFWA